MIKKLIIFLAFGLVLILLNACNEASPSSEPSQTAVIRATYTPTRTASPAPSVSPAPTLTATPMPTPIVYASYAGPVPQGALARLGKGSIQTIALSPRGDYLAVASYLAIYMYHLDPLEEIWSLLIEGETMSLVFSPDGSMFALATEKGEIRLFETISGDPILSWQVPFADEGGLYFLSFLPDGQRLVSVSSDFIGLWDITDGGLLLSLQHDYIGLSDVAVLSPDGKTLALGSTHFISLWDLTQGKLTDLLPFNATIGGYGEPYGYVSSLAFSPDGKVLASGHESYYMSIRIWDVRIGEQLIEIPPGDYSYKIDSLAFSSDGKTLTSSSEERVAFWDPANGLLTGELETMDISARKILFAPDGRTLISQSENEISFWDIVNGHKRMTLKGFGADHFCSILEDNEARGLVNRLWDAETLCPIMNAPEYRGLYFEAISPDGRILIFGETKEDAEDLLFFEKTSGKLIRRLSFDSFLYDVSFSKDGSLLGFYQGYSIQIGNLSTLLNTSDPAPSFDYQLIPEGYLSQVAFSSDLKIVVARISGENDETILWDIVRDETLILSDVGAVDEIALSLDGKMLAFSQNSDVPGNSRITLWDINSGKTISILYGDWFDELAFSPDGGVLAYIEYPDLLTGNALGLWNYHQGKSTLILYSGDGYLENMHFSSDGTLLAADLDYSPYGNDSIVFLDLNSPLPSIQPISTAAPSPTPTPTPTTPPPEQRLLGRDMGEILKMTFSPSGDRLTIASSIGVYIFQNNLLKELWRWPHAIDRQFPLAVSSDGTLVASVFVDEVPRNNLVLWDVPSGSSIFTIPLTSDPEVIALAFTPDNQILLAASKNGNISYWDVKRGELIREMKGEPYSIRGSVLFSPDGRYLSFVAQSIVHLWDLSGDSPERIQVNIIGCDELDDYTQSGDYVQSFSADGQTLSVACDSSYHYHSGYVNRINVRYGALIDIEPVETSIQSFAFTPDGQITAYGLCNGTLILVDEMNDIWLPLRGHANELYPPSIDDEGEVIEYGNTITSLAFSPDSSTLAAGSKDGSVILIKLASSVKPDPDDLACSLQLGQEVHASQESRLWFEPDVNTSISAPSLPEKELYILPGPRWAPILKGTVTSGWYWQVGYSPFGASAGWIWEGRLEECQ